MMRLPSSFVISCIITTTIIASDVHKTKRQEILLKEALQSVGGTTTLTDKEAVVNNCLMRHKFNEVDNGFDKPEYYNFSHHYFSYKNRIKDSKVYRIIRDLPKGAALHVHDMAILKADYLLNITYMDHLYVCLDTDIDFLFADSTPKTKCASGWQLMSDARRKSGNIKKFDKELKKHFSMVCDDPDKLYPTIKETWSTFLKYFSTVIKLLTYMPNWDRYFYDVLKAFRDDNIMYVEIRSILPELYELDGTTYDSLITAKAYKKTINRFIKDYPDYIGAKLIFAPSRYIDRPQLDLFLLTAKKIKKEMPDYFAGFDLVGPEDRGKPLIEFVPQLEASAVDLNYFFHAGETDWYGTSTDCNLVDAILLGAKRLGHAYALPKHPVLMEEVRKRDIGIEVNVISNSVLSLVHDVRNHPLSVFLANGLPVVLSSDDPGAWDAEPISHDFYVAFVGVASRLQDLRLLKTLALNSLKYSALDEAAKLKAYEMFGARWNDFVNKFNCSDY